MNEFETNIRPRHLRRIEWRIAVKNILNLVHNSLRSNCLRCVALAGPKLALIAGVCLLAGMAAAQPANDNFAGKQSLGSAQSGYITSSNIGSTLESGAGESNVITDSQGNQVVITNSVWFAWTAPSNGVVSFDTFGSDFDTVLAVYQTSFAIGNLMTSAVNDDYIPGIVPQSYITFSAQAGQTYFISVNGSANPQAGYTNQGNYVLEWNETVPVIASGTFQFTKDTYTVSDLDGNGTINPAMGAVPPIHGARVTVTRTEGSSGRVLVPYSYNAINNEGVAVTNINVTPGGGFLAFDDFQMSADIVIPVPDNPASDTAFYVTNYNVLTNNVYITNGLPATNWFFTNIVFTNVYTIAPPGQIQIALGGPSLDPQESSDLIPPTNGVASSSIVRILGHRGGVDASDQAYPSTNAYFYMERSTFRVQRTAGSATIYVYPSQAPPKDHTYTVQYAIDYDFTPGSYSKTVTPLQLHAQGHVFGVQAGSDYAVPDTDFTDITGGKLTWAAFDATPKAITIPILNTTNAAFNQDFEVELYNPLDGAAHLALGQDNKSVVTILFDKQPAGAVDKTWNADGKVESNPPYLQYPGAQGGVSDSANGNGGMVYAVAEQPDGKAIIAGSFISYNSTAYNRIVRVLSTGYPDTNFLVAPNGGANGAINSVVLQSDGKIIIGGEFTSFNGTARNHVARLNTDGTVDTTFNPGLGADGKVWAAAIESDGKIIIGGEFQNFNGTASRYLARLNVNGTLDATFNVGSTISGNVYALAIPAAGNISINRGTSGAVLEDDNSVNLGLATAGTLTFNYDFLQVPDNMRVYYGGTNGVRIYDTGMINGTGTLVIPFGPTNGLVTNLITIVMDQGNGTPGTLWSYTATIQTISPTQIYAAGGFTSVGGAKRGGLARFNSDGTLDTAFDPGIGTFNPTTGNTDAINALAVQSDGHLLAGGSFSHVDMIGINGLTRFNIDGTLDMTFSTLGTNNGTFNPQTRIADQVKVIALQPDGKILIGGDFTTFNQTRRVGIARLYADGSVDTTFMDTAYNQFAGIINHYHNPDAVDLNDYPQGNHRNSVLAIAQEAGGNVIIGGNFLRVGGGSYLHGAVVVANYRGDGVYGVDNADEHGIVYNGRMDVHPRSNVARLVGGATAGPGNIGLNYNKYSVDKDGGTLDVQLIRSNGHLGYATATFYALPGTLGQQGVAIENTDFSIGNVAPLWDWATGSWTLSTGVEGLSANLGFGNPADETLYITNNTLISGNLNAYLSLKNPLSVFGLGGEVIPLGVSLGGILQSALTIIDDNFPAGTFGFSSPSYTVNENLTTATIMVTRTGGTRGSVQVSYATMNGTATYPANYTLTHGTLTFADGDTSKTFSVGINPKTISGADKTVNLVLYGITGGGKPGVTNSVLTIVNNNYTYGHIAFAFATNGVNEAAGTAPVVVNRLGGGSGTIDVTYTVTNGTATNGVNFIGTTNVIHWDDTDVSAKTINVPVLHDGVLTSNLTVKLQLISANLNSTNAPNVLGFSTVTNSTLVITNVDFPGAVEFTSGSYSVKKTAGFALIPVIRTGGSAGTVTAGFKTVDNTAINGVDYTATNGLLTFTNGVVSQYIQIPITKGSPSGPVMFNVVLTNTVNNPSNAVLNIIDTMTVNEPPGSVDVTFDPNAGCNGNVYSLVLQTNNQILVAGDFTMANGVPRQRIARLNADGSLDSGFSLPTSSMGANEQVRVLAVQTDGRIILAGNFTAVNSVPMNRIARLNYDGTLDSLFDPGSGADSPVNAVAETFVNGSRKIVVGGAFSQLNGMFVNFLGRMNDNGSTDTTFNPGGVGANGAVSAIAVQPSDGKIIIGGDFTQFNGMAANHIARLNVDGTLDTTFNATANDSVRAIVIQLDGQILAGGLFTSLNNNTNFNHIGRITSASGTNDLTFNPGVGANGSVLSIALGADSKIVLGGTFSQCNGVTRNGITRLNPDGTVDPSINFGSGADSFVAAALVQQGTIPGYPGAVPDEKIIIGGGFTHYNSVAEAGLARIYGGSMSGSGTFQFSAPNYVVKESGTNVVVTVVRTGGTTGDVMVGFAMTNVTAIPGFNYSNILTQLEFPPGEVLQFVTIPVMDDLVITNDLTVNLTLTPVAPADVGNQPTAVLTIVNVDNAITFSTPNYVATRYSTNYPTGVARIYVNRVGATFDASSVVFNTVPNGSAMAGTDYGSVTNYVVNFPPGVASQTVLIPILNGTSDGLRTVSLVLSAVTNSILAAPSTATLTILDGTQTPGSLQFSALNYSVTEGGGVGWTNAVVTVIRTNGTYGTVSVDYSTSDGTATVGAGKYNAANGTLTFADGEMSKVILVRVLNKATVEPTESFSIQLANPTAGVTLLAPTSATVTISNINTGLAFTQPATSVYKTNGSVDVNVTWINYLAGLVSVDYTTVDGTATNGVDYVFTHGTLYISNGLSLYPIHIPLSGSTNVTGNRQFSILLTNAVNVSNAGTVLIGSPGVETITLLDPYTALSFTTNVTSVGRSIGSVVLTVTCSNTNAEPVSVSYATADGATGVAGVDYMATNGVLTFSNGVASMNVMVPIIPSALLAGSNTFTVGLFSPTGNGVIVTPATNTVNIINNNSGMQFSSSSYLANKLAGSALITVYRTGYTDSVASVNFLTTNGTAIAGMDYVATNGTLVFAKGATSATFSVSITNAHAVAQPDMTLTLLLASPTNGILINPTVATLTIHDNSGSHVIPAGSQIISENVLVNGIIDPNETVTMRFGFRVVGGNNVNNLFATLMATSGVTPVSGSDTNNYGPLIYKGHAVSRPFSFTATGTNQQPIAVTFQLRDGLVNLGTATFNYIVGSWTTTVSNNTTIVINDNTMASPYPSVIAVSQLGGSLIKATVTLNKLTHTSVHDVDALVVSPSGANTLIMAHAGSSSGTSVTNAVLTFDDAAASPLPSFGSFTSGTNRPTQYSPTPSFH